MLIAASAAIACLYLLLIIPLLGVPEIYQVSEGREGVVVDEMLRTGEMILPLRHGSIVPSKPMLYHWIAAGAERLHGQSDEFVLRFPSAIAASLLLALTCWVFGRVNRGRGVAESVSAGLLASAILGLTLGYFRLATDARVDMICLAFSAGAILTLFEPLIALSSTPCPDYGTARSYLNNARLTAFSVFVGLAVLAKGPIGLMLPALVIIPYIILAAGPRALGWFARWPLLLCAVLPLPWYLLAVVKGHSSFIARQIIFENFGRFFGAAGITQKPFWFYLPHLMLEGAPVTEIFLALLICAAIPRLRGTIKTALEKIEPHERIQIKFFLVWIGFQFLFFSASAGKRSSYLVSLFPPLAMTLALLIRCAAKSGKAAAPLKPESEYKSLRMAGYLAWSLLPIFSASIVLSSRYAGPDMPGSSSFGRTVFALSQAIWQAPRTFAIFLSLFVISGLFFLERSRVRARLLAISALLFWGMIVFLITPLVHGVRGITHGYKSFAARVAAAVPESERLVFIKTAAEESFDGFFFYVKRRIEITDSLDPPAQSGTYLARSSWIERTPPQWHERIKPILRGGRLVDTSEKEVVLFRLEEAKPAVPPEVHPDTESMP